MEIKIKRLTPGLLDDFLYFFDKIAFTDNPAWKDCYCCYHYFPEGPEWLNRTGAENREEAVKLLISGRMNGYLAYFGNKPVGWCHTDDLSKLVRLNTIHKEEEPGRTGAISCFIVAPHLRRKGIAGKLLEKAIEDFKASGYQFLECFPEKEMKTDAENYHGPVFLYRNLGFELLEEHGNTLIYRKILFN